ncbi:hypothetical protein SAMN05216474_1574 [Lishizhenia tianjinensis]|uniref:Lipoprotein n=1 Tax=Lishizhenia tianjinensis TaxID=477690 RepID=A0A1I6ZRW8_9FLAO|nr:hypothetical protein [Lishizhenia tianjinensis]SFT65420.1 hypothetical protein SAMN05216474_1574 [Lishizhenia tianjinensis]
MKTLRITLLASLVALSFTQCNKASRCKGEVCTQELGANEIAGDITEAQGTFTLNYKAVASGGDFTGGMEADFYVSKKNQLVVAADSRCVTLEGPYKVSSNEVTFKDDCEYHCSFKVKRTGSELTKVTVLNSVGEILGVFE